LEVENAWGEKGASPRKKDEFFEGQGGGLKLKDLFWKSVFRFVWGAEIKKWEF